jgi:hypothetical protein
MACSVHLLVYHEFSSLHFSSNVLVYNCQKKNRVILFHYCSFENNPRLKGPELQGLVSYDTGC